MITHVILIDNRAEKKRLNGNACQAFYRFHAGPEGFVRGGPTLTKFFFFFFFSL